MHFFCVFLLLCFYSHNSLILWVGIKYLSVTYKTKSVAKTFHHTQEICCQVTQENAKKKFLVQYPSSSL